MADVDSSLGFEEKILEQATRSPSVAMLRLSLEIDRQLRLILAVIGRLKSYTGQSPREALDLIAMSNEGSGIPSELRDTLNNFWSLRNLIVHGERTNDGLTMRALDYGFRILRMLQAVPRPSYIVFDLTAVFSDAACHQPRRDIRGLLLDSRAPSGESRGRHVYPSRKDYTTGQSVSWEWDASGEGWGPTWFRDKVTQEVKLAWSESLEFIGRPLEQI